MQYSIQGLNCDDAARKDLLMDIGTEELSHLEVVGTLARLHLAHMKHDRDAAEADPLIAIAGGGGVNLYNSMGSPWTADYLKITGELDVDLRSNIAAEARAKIVYERLIDFCDDAGSKDALQFLMTREITHMKAFAAALESMEKPPFSIGRIAPSAGIVNQFYNDSTGTGDLGEVDTRGPWNEGGDWEFVQSPAMPAPNGNGHGGAEQGAETAEAALESSIPAEPDAIHESLVEHLRDLLHAERQLVKALPKMAKAAHAEQLRDAFELHLAETEVHVERLTEVLDLLGEGSARAKPCRGMMGLIEEGEEVITENKKREPFAADLNLIAAAHKVEHYEIASYTTARNLANQLRLPEVSRLLQMTLAEEQNTDMLLDQIQRPLTSVLGRPAAIM
jgi:Mn-containing catalase